MAYLDNTELTKIGRRIDRYSTKLPDSMGRTAVRTFLDSWKRRGWIEDKTVEPWAPRKAKEKGRKRALLVRSGRMRRATRQLPAHGGKTAIVVNDTPYARAHNEGAQFTREMEITPKMRRFFWARFFETQDEMWKALALKKGKIRQEIDIPKRQFMGVSPFLERRILMQIERDLKRIFTVS